MRRRLLVVLSAFSFIAVAAFALPLLNTTAAERTQRFTLSRSADLDHFAALAQQAADPQAAAVLAQRAHEHSALYGEGVLVVSRTGRPIVEAGLHIADPGVSEAVDAALRNQPTISTERLGPWSDEPILLSRPVGTGTQGGGAVVLRASPAAAASDIAFGWLVVLAGAFTAAVMFAALALALARWVLRPVAELTAGVRAVAAGHPGAHVSPRAGPSELRELAAAFNRMSDVVATSANQQRRLVADTSHQLRNPLAALRLRIDTLDAHVGAGGRRAYRSAVDEVERLESLLDGMLDLASAESRATDVAAGQEGAAATDIAGVVAARAELWGPLAEQAGLRLVVTGGPAVAAACSASELSQVLDVLLDNAVQHAGSGTTVCVGWSAHAGRVRLEVRDDGPGLAADEMARATERFWRSPSARKRRGSGLGLSIAEQLLRGRDGVLRLARAPGGGLLVTVEVPCPRP